MHDDAPATPAHAYQRYFGPAIFEPLTSLVVADAPPPAGGRVLDVACGTGILTRRLAALAGPAATVVGVDLNPGMLAVASTIPSPGGAPIEWRQGDGADLDLDDASFDAAYCQQGLQFFGDRAAGAAELRRVVAPGGTAVIACWKGLDHHPLYAAMAEAEEPHLQELGVELTIDELAAPFSLGDAGELAGLLHTAGFDTVEVLERSVDARFADADRFVERMEFAYAAVIPQFAEDPASFERYLAAITDATTDLVASARRGDEVVVPMHAHLAIAR